VLFSLTTATTARAGAILVTATATTTPVFNDIATTTAATMTTTPMHEQLPFEGHKTRQEQLNEQHAVKHRPLSDKTMPTPVVAAVAAAVAAVAVTIQPTSQLKSYCTMQNINNVSQTS